jgi:putative transposase
VTADKFYPSSKLCSRCGCLNRDLKLSDRVFCCPECKLKINRDLNAALNLLKLSTGSSSGSYACRDTSDGKTQRKLWPTSYVSLKQEADTKIPSGIFG